jgi:transposase-like protein
MMNSQRRSGEGTRRSAEKERIWRGHVAGQKRSKLSVRGYCEQVGVSEPSFYAWRRELSRRRQRTVPLAPPTAPPKSTIARRALAKQASPTTASFLPVTIAPEASGAIEFALPSGLLIRVPAHDVAAVQAILTLLERPAC